MMAAQELAATLLACSPASLHMTKKLLCDFAAPEIDRELELAMEESARIRTTAISEKASRRSWKSARRGGASSTDFQSVGFHQWQRNRAREPRLVPLGQRIAKIRWNPTDLKSVLHLLQFPSR